MSNYLYDGVFAPHAASSKTFLYTADGEVSYADFTALTDRIANTLVAEGVTPTVSPLRLSLIHISEPTRPY